MDDISRATPITLRKPPYGDFLIKVRWAWVIKHQQYLTRFRSKQMMTTTMVITLFFLQSNDKHCKIAKLVKKKLRFDYGL